MQVIRFIPFVLFFALPASPLVSNAESTPQGNEQDRLAVAFGKVPQQWGARLSPDGSKISFLHMDGADIPVAYVFDTDSGSYHPVTASKPGVFDVVWCKWANDERLLCGFHGINNFRGSLIPVTRLVAVNADGTKQIVLLQDQLRDEFTQFQDDIVDWLPDDPEHVLMEVPSEKGTGVSRVNIYSGKLRKEDRVYDGTREWISDGHGITRLRQYVSTERLKWYYRLADDRRWYVLHEAKMTDIEDDFYPLGFGEDRNAILVVKPHKGRLALWLEDLTNQREDQVIYAHSNVDVSGTLTLGKFSRIVAVGYSTDKSHYHFFDKDVERITRRVGAVQPGKNIIVVDESWDKKFYLIHISSDQDPGQYYRLDIDKNILSAMDPKRPELEGHKLAEMTPIHYSARDGVSIPGYLTLPPKPGNRNLPAIVTPHGGPESRDNWDFNWLSQFFASKGYAVLQSNFRGSGGFGAAWAGEGGFRAWRKTINDITDGTQWIIDQGIADPNRICIVGWSYGGYAALMSAIEESELYQCVVSIAGVTDPSTLIRDYRKYLNRQAVRAFVGTDENVLDLGSPLRRAQEIQSPVLLFHGDKDLNVDIKHSKKMHKALEKANKSTKLVIYEDTAHGIWRDDYRIDMLTRIDRFLGDNIGEGTSSSVRRNEN